MEIKPGTIHQLLDKFDWALSELGGKPGPRDLESLAVLVFEAMTNRDRTFHNPWHIFNVASNGSPVETLAALFHDVVYYQVDEGFPNRLGKLLQPFVQEDDKGLKLKPQGFKKSPSARLVLEIFGIESDQRLSLRAGQNEVLSAIAAVKALDRFLLPKECVAIACAIEATIPFRRPDKRGRTPMQRLALRLADVNKRRRLGLDDESMHELMRGAVRMGNSDVENFSEKEPGAFLDNTWRLLPETNPALRAAGLYTIREYRVALQKMEIFLGSLEPTSIFQGYDGFPEDATLRAWTEAARKNLELSVRYLRAKIAAVSILEALAECTGGDAPIGLFMGDLPDPGMRYRRVDDYLPQRASWNVSREADPTVLALLEQGRTADIWFDSRRSPLAAFVYAAIGDTGIKKVIDRAQRLFEKKLPPAAFLATLPDHVVGAIASACAKMVRTRSAALESLDRRESAALA